MAKQDLKLQSIVCIIVLLLFRSTSTVFWYKSKLGSKHQVPQCPSYMSMPSKAQRLIRG